MASRAARERLHPVPPLQGEDRQAWLAAIVESSFDAIVGQTPAGTITSWNAGAEQIYGYLADEVLGRSIDIIVPPHRIAEWRAAYARVQRGEQIEPFETERVTKDGRLLHVTISLSPIRDQCGMVLGIAGIGRDFTERKQAELLIGGQKRALELIAQSAPLSEVLDALVRTVEEQSTCGAIASILLFDEHGECLRHGAAPRLPESYSRALDGHPIGPAAGACGTAAYRRELVVAEDIAIDPLWADYRDLALSYRLRACWSTPILDRDDRLLGTFASYYREPRPPGAADLQAVAILSRTAAIAIERKRAEEALRESAQHTRRVLDGLGALVMVTARSGRLLEVNRTALEEAGLTPAEVVGRPLADTYWWSHSPEARDRLGLAIAHAARGRLSRYDTTLRVGPDRQLTVDFTLNPLTDGHGRVSHLIASAIDISARKQAEREQHLLLEELNHRVKNTLATAKSLAAQTLRSNASPESFVEAFNGRLAALASAHTLLAEARWAGTGLHDLIRRQLAPYQAPDSDHVRILGENVLLSPSAALTLGLVLHELTTNAAKHGALASAKGRIEIAMQVFPDTAGQRRLSLTWTERGASQVVRRRERGFGSTMIEQGLAYQLGGKAALEFASDGVRCAIEFPLAEAHPPLELPDTQAVGDGNVAERAG
jgi:PAS domain S-box-containing protein